MCFHDERQRRRYEEALKRARKDKTKTTAWLHVHPIGMSKIKFSMPVTVNNQQEIANTLQDLLHWHPGTVPDVLAVNQARDRLDYGYISLHTLPEPDRPPQPGIDVEKMPEERMVETIKEYALTHA